MLTTILISSFILLYTLPAAYLIILMSKIRLSETSNYGINLPYVIILLAIIVFTPLLNLAIALWHLIESTRE